jgi:hypothetical protein
VALGQGNLAGVARVAFEAQTGEFNADVSVAEARYRQATKGMSDDAIRLELAQERLRRALAKGPGAYREIANAELNLRRVQQGLRADTDRLTASQNRNERSLGGIRNRLIAYAGAYVGAQGLVYGIRRALDVSSNLDEQTDKTRRVFGAASRQVEEFASRALGLANDEALELASTFGALLRPIGIVGRESAKLSEDLVRRGVDLSSFYNREVRDALEALRSGIVGESEPLRTFGVRLSEARVQSVALAQSEKTVAKELTESEKLRARIAIIFEDSAIAADNYRQTIDGVANQEREAAANYRDTLGLIGRSLTPGYRTLLRAVNDYLGDAENQERIQRKVNEAVETGTEVVRGLAGGLKIVKGAIAPVVDALGGVENAVQLALIVGIVAKARRAASSFGLIAAASAATRTKVIADAAAMGTALDVATRPRNVVITTSGIPGGTVTAGGGRGGRVPGGFRSALPILATQPAIAVAVATLSSGGGGTQRGDRSSQYPLTFDAVGRAASGIADPEELAILRAELGSYSLANAPDERMRSAEQRLQRFRRNQSAPPGDVHDRSDAGERVRRRRRREGLGDGARGRTIADVELDLARAGTTRDRGDDARLLRELLALYEGQVRALERRKTLTEEQREKLRTLYGQIASVQSQLDSIADEGEQQLREQRERARERRERIREREERRMRAVREAAARAAQNRLELLGGVPGTREGMRRAALRGVDETVSGLRGRQSDRQQEFDRLSFEFLSSLRGIGNQFGSNLFPPGTLEGIATHAHVQTELLRELNRTVARSVAGARFAGTHYSRAELAASGLGSGF